MTEVGKAIGMLDPGDRRRGNTGQKFISRN